MNKHLFYALRLSLTTFRGPCRLGCQLCPDLGCCQISVAKARNPRFSQPNSHQQARSLIFKKITDFVTPDLNKKNPNPQSTNKKKKLLSRTEKQIKYPNFQPIAK